MSASTVHPLNPRAEALVRRIAELGSGASDAALEALTLGLVDTLLAADHEALEAALTGLRDARVRADGSERLGGWLDGAIGFAHWGLERLGPASPAAADGTHAAAFLESLRGSAELSSADLRQLLETDETQVSRTARRLLDSGLVTRRKVGKRVFWRLSPRGRSALESRASGAEQPGPAKADPRFEHIVSSTLELHTLQGIAATSWEDIAARAGVPVATVKEIFPTQDDLIRSCGQHLFTRLALPAPERASEVFAGLETEPQRVERLVATLFDAYEREGDALERGRSERADLPALDETLADFDASLDALVAEALEARRPDATTVASVRGLTDLSVWRTLRDQGGSAEAAVQEAGAAVERWLEAQPTGS